jgi:branched-chain amino acid transport system ATP-binding protein
MSLTDYAMLIAATGKYVDPRVRDALLAQVKPQAGSSKPDPILTVDAIEGSSAGETAVHVDHLEVQRGIITAVIGPRGAGKTSFVDLVTGLGRPSPGARLWFDGRRLDRVSASALADAGLVRTIPLTRSLQRMTVLDNVLLGARGPRGESVLSAVFTGTWGAQARETEEQALDLLHEFGLHAARDDQAGSLSADQRTLLQIARALMSDPTMIVLDEPTAGLAPASRPRLCEHIESLRDEGLTVLLVEHDLHVVRQVADWVVVMAGGRIVAEGRADSHLTEPAAREARL